MIKLNHKTYFKRSSYLSPWDFALFLIPISMVCFLSVFYFYVLFQHLNYKGVEAIKNNNPNSAVQYFSQSVEEQPLKPWPHLNLALAHDLAKNPLKSLQIYKVISSQFNDTSQFFSYFNQAELNGRLGFLDKALENYQAALEFKYKEKEIKENIELLFQKDKNKDSKNKNKKDKPSSGEEKKNQENGKGEEGKSDNSQEKQEQDKNNLEESRKNKARENEQLKPGDVSKEQEQAILKAIEQQEVDVRAKAFKKKGQYGDKTGKDW